MSRMTGKTAAVTGGIDTHADTHEAAVLDEHGRLLAVEEFPTTPSGYQQLLDWMRGFGAVREIGVEFSGSYGAALTRHLRSAGVKVVEVNRPHPHTRNRRGKNDAIDAEAAARKVLAGECTAVPKDTTGIVEAIRQLPAGPGQRGTRPRRCAAPARRTRRHRPSTGANVADRQDTGR